MRRRLTSGLSPDDGDNNGRCPRDPAIGLLLPKDTNAYGTIFGGVILSNIDLASAVEARKVAPHRYVPRRCARSSSTSRCSSATS